MTGLLAGPARGQAGASISVATEERFRGEALSHGRPVATLALAYDAPGGAYLGASIVGVATAHAGAQVLATEEYAGFARRVSPELTLDAGLTNASYTEYYSGGRAVDYQEVYVGLIGRTFSSHIHYSPDYLDRGYATLYGEVDGIWRSPRDVRLLAHLGWLAPLEGGYGGRADWRIGVGADLMGLDLQAAWTGLSRRGDHRLQAPPRQAIVISATRSF